MLVILVIVATFACHDRTAVLQVAELNEKITQLEKQKAEDAKKAEEAKKADEAKKPEEKKETEKEDSKAADAKPAVV